MGAPPRSAACDSGDANSASHRARRPRQRTWVVYEALLPVSTALHPRDNRNALAAARGSACAPRHRLDARPRAAMHTHPEPRLPPQRVRGGHEDVVFSEELNFGAGREARCCHSDCLGYIATKPRASSTPATIPMDVPRRATSPPLTEQRTEAPAPGVAREASNGERCHAASLRYDDTPPLAPSPPNGTANRWPRSELDGSIASFGARRYGTTRAGLPLMQLAWRPDEFNTLHVPLHRFGRCTGRHESCIGVHPDCPPPPPPFQAPSTTAGSSRSRSRRAKPRRVKPRVARNQPVVG